MIPGIWTSFLIEFSPEDMIVQFAKKGWSDLELSDEHAKMLLDRGGDPAAVGEEFKRFAADHGVRFPQGHLWLACDIVVDDQDAVIEQLKPWMDLFVATGIRAGVLHPGGGPLFKQGEDPEMIHQKRVSGFRPLAEYAAGSDLVISIENMGGAGDKAKTADDLLRIVEDVGGPNMGICLDTSHLNIGGPSDPAGFVRAVGDRLTALHLCDNDHSGDQHLLPFARGTVPWLELFPALKEIGYKGLLNWEIPGENRCPIPVRLAKLDYLKAIFPLMIEGMPSERQADGKQV